MKRTFEIHSQKLNCDIQFTYTSNGSLCGFQIMDNTDRDIKAIVPILEIALTLEDLKTACKNFKIKLMEILQDLSFEAFWNAYNYKDGGSKKKAITLWGKLSDSKRAAAITYIVLYEQHLRLSGLSKAYATTYLNNEYWDK